MTLVSDIVRVNFLSTLANGQAVSNSFHVHKSGLGIPGLTELTNVANDVDTWFTTAYRLLLGTSDTLKAIRTFQQDDSNPKGPYLEYVLNKNVAGTSTKTATAPASSCGVISFQSSVAKRYARGHIFAPPLLNNADFTSGNLINSGGNYWAVFAPLAAKFAAGCGASPTWTGTTLSGYHLAIYSRVQDKVVGNAVTDCATAVAQPQVHWLRSRERGSS